MRILVTGACGYKGTVLVPKLLSKGHEVIGFDLMWFGNYLKPHLNLRLVKGDIRNINEVPLKDVDIVIHLSSIANDPCGDLDPKLTWEVSALATMQLAEQAKREGVKQFIFASSGSVYGINDELNVTEEIRLNPISEYNKTKMVSERVLLSYEDEMIIQIVRPATVCGYSPRMRLDVSVNLLTIQALTKREITVFGGNQIRPNIHIEDITDLYLFLIQNPQYTGIFNAGFENLTIYEIATKIQTYMLDVEIKLTPSNDPRSYRINSDKLLSLGFTPKKTVNDAIIELIKYFNEGVLINNDECYNLNWMIKNNYINK